MERAYYWKSVGASFSETVLDIIDRVRNGKSLKDRVRPETPSKKAKAKAEAEAKAKAEAAAKAEAEAKAKAEAEAAAQPAEEAKPAEA